tara:strand:- start:1466 stop:1609 length:144 start_codon:yes stop_codon:yes gene_type:complete
MSKDLINRIKQWNDKKYGNIDYPDRTVIILKTLKPEGTVTTAPKYKE